MRERTGGLGTFAGVFTPSVLTILGLVLFRRLGYVVGAAGTLHALAIWSIAHGISVLTSASLSAIATNLRVKGGGDYYLISRSLGVEFGGALGIVLFLAQAVSVAFYCIGFGEAVVAVLPPDAAVRVPTVAAAATLFLFAFAWLGADWATRLQYVVMTALALGLASFFAGGLGAFSIGTFARNWADGAPEAPGFWPLFALFFPAVTGFTQGVSMSGDLKDPGRSLPLGTFAAVGVSMAIYLAAALVFAGSQPNATLAVDYEAMGRISAWPALVTVGIVAATLSSALASFLGAPRILQALAADRVFPVLSPFAAVHGPACNPRRGILLTLAIALGGVSLGGINVIAPVVSMFFLISYGLLNYATALEARAASPSFRPRFRWFHYRASLVGAVGCLGVMLMINPWASAVALVFVFALYQYVQRLRPRSRWADSRRDLYFHGVRTNLLAMAREPVHPRNWRPHLLVFSDEPRRRDALVRFASRIEGGAGVTTVVRILEDDGEGAMERRREAEKELVADIAARHLNAFALVVSAPQVDVAAQTVVQAYGLGPVRANTILLNWIDHPSPAEWSPAALNERLFVRTLRAAARLGVNVIVLDAKEAAWKAVEEQPDEARRIDVWWSDNPTGRLALLLAYMMTRSEEWQQARIRLLAWVAEGAEEKMRAHIAETLEDVRIEAEVQTLTNLTPEKLVVASADASLVFLPLRLRSLRVVDPCGEPIEALLEDLPVVALVSAVEDIALDAGPEEGEPARVAALSDAAEDAQRQVREVDKSLERARTLAQRTAQASSEARAALAAIEQDEAQADAREKLRQKVRDAVSRADAAEQRLRQLERQATRIHVEAQDVADTLAEIVGPEAAEPPAKD